MTIGQFFRRLPESTDFNIGAARLSGIFMYAPTTSGIDKRGKTVFLRHPSGEYILDEEGSRVPDDQISMVSQAFADWRSSSC